MAQNFKKLFPFFTEGAHKGLVYLDSAATAQKFAAVMEAEMRFYRDENANVHRGIYGLSERATALYEGARHSVTKFLNAPSEKCIVFTSGATHALNMVAQGWGAQFLEEGDEILLSILEHHSNIVPWQLIAERKGCRIKYIDIKADGTLDLSELDSMLTQYTKIVSVTGLSNALGTLTPLAEIIEKAHRAGAKVCVDAAQLAAHSPIDVQKLDCDFLAFSGHKVYGPTGIGVLYAKEEILNEMRPFFGGGEMIREVKRSGSTWNDLPWKFEAGTPPIAQAIGLGTALTELMKIGWDAIEPHECDLMSYAIEKLKIEENLRLLGPLNTAHHRAALSFTLEGVHAHDIGQILDSEGVAIRVGHHCCMPLMKHLCIPATARISFGLYNERADIDAFCEALKKVRKIFKL